MHSTNINHTVNNQNLLVTYDSKLFSNYLESDGVEDYYTGIIIVTGTLYGIGLGLGFV